MTEVLRAVSLPLVAVAAAVVLVGLVRALGTRGWSAAVVFGGALALALEFLLAAGVLRLSGLRLPALGVVALVVIVRQVIARGVRFGERAVVSRPTARSRAGS